MVCEGKFIEGERVYKCEYWERRAQVTEGRGRVVLEARNVMEGGVSPRSQSCGPQS